MTSLEVESLFSLTRIESVFKFEGNTFPKSIMGWVLSGERQLPED